MDKFELEDIYLNMFLEETNELIEKMEQELVELEVKKTDTAITNSIFRIVHSIKGASAAMGFTYMADLSHRLESILNGVRNNRIIIDNEMMDILFKGIDILKSLHKKAGKKVTDEEDYSEFFNEINKIADLQNSNADSFETIKNAENTPDSNIMLNTIIREELIELTEDEKIVCSRVEKSLDIYKTVIVFDENTIMKSIKAFLIVNNLMGISEIVKTAPKDFEQLSDKNFGQTFEIIIATNREYDIIYQNISSISEINNIFIKKVSEGKKVSSNHKNAIFANETQNINHEDISKIRIDINKIDKLLYLVEEFVVSKENLNQIGLELKKRFKNDSEVYKLQNILPMISSIGTELQETVLSIRMMALENIFNRFPRMIRDLAQRCKKKVKLVIEGKDTEIDRGIIEELTDPLIHILRNAVDHGIEAPEERKLLNKAEEGSLTIRARHEENSVILEVEDDGRGIDLEKIKYKALEFGMTTEKELMLMPQSEIINFIFYPGFSTSEVVSDISGRGVGLDVVKSNIGKLNGIIDIKTELGKGTKFIIKLPLTLAIIKALIIKEDEYLFALPITLIIEILRLKGNQIEERIHMVGGNEFLEWRGQSIHIVRLNNYFGINSKVKEDKLIIVVVGFSEKKAAFVVERLIGAQEIVIKPLVHFIGKGKLFGEIKGISGVSILGNGNFAHILDAGTICMR